MLFMLIALLFATAAVSQPPDFTVAADGSGDFRTVAAAVASIPRANRERVVILVKRGVYREKVRVDAACVTVRGADREATRLEFSQLNDDFVADPDAIGRAVLNVNADDFVLENITVANTAGVVGQHAFAIYGTADRTVIVDSNVLSDGADTLSLWNGARGRYYHARCNFRGAVDFVCPRGWCYIKDSTFFETKPSAAMWHDGSKNQDQKFVLERCRFDGVAGWALARHHVDGAFYFLDCEFSQSLSDRAPYRVIYPLDGGSPSPADTARNQQLAPANRWGERAYFDNCQRAGGSFSWMANNLQSAFGAPRREEINAAWTFGGSWNPEAVAGPAVESISAKRKSIELRFSEPVTVRGKPRLELAASRSADYVSGSGSDTLHFAADNISTAGKFRLDRSQGRIFASRASAASREVDETLSRRRKLRIALVGDSTVTEGSGWGAGFKRWVTDDVDVINAAQNGRSSKSYRAEGRWEPVLASRPDYVLIQFGHNDQPGKGPERESPADTEFRANLTRYVAEARAAGSDPILVTSLVRRKFDANGKLVSDLAEYVNVTKQVAEATKTPLVDLHARSLALCERLGPIGCRPLEPTSNGQQDTTHLNGAGSALMGALVAEELAQVAPAIKPYVRAAEAAATTSGR